MTWLPDIPTALLPGNYLLWLPPPPYLFARTSLLLFSPTSEPCILQPPPPFLPSHHRWQGCRHRGGPRRSSCGGGGGSPGPLCHASGVPPFLPFSLPSFFPLGQPHPQVLFDPLGVCCERRAHLSLCSPFLLPILLPLATPRQGDVLVATTLIENGLDVPSVNTVVVAQVGREGGEDAGRRE